MIDAYNLQYPLNKAPNIDGISKAHVIQVSCDEVKLWENAAFENAYVQKSLKENADFTHPKEKEIKQGRKTVLVKVL